MAIDMHEVRDPRAQKLREGIEAQIQEQEAVIAYVAMMADVDIEGDGDEPYVQQD